MYLRKKVVNGKTYFSIVRSYRKDGKVKQETVEHLGNAAKAYQILLDKSSEAPLLHFMQMIQQDPEALYKRCKQIPYSRVLQERFQQEDPPEDPLELAARFFYLNRSSMLFGNARSYFKAKGGSFRSSVFGKEARRYQKSIEKIQLFAKRFREVVIEQQSFEKILKKYDSADTLFYLDPPYYRHEIYYDGGFSWHHHKLLNYLLKQIQGKFVLSYGDHQSIKALYQDFSIRTIPGYKQVIGQGTFRTNELIIDNFSNVGYEE